ncbi:ComEC/Rec2 family competence protein [Conyzicola nivalis]|uniref:Competence protein ComEC n=1 Tax=Conyzicola nivalis TaxID=1477021 RepID=A0A916SIP6_9MICO|nr:ComEC/Rec2 family competence protein [Conyzicola nivalis]GGA98255.1 competence protein ComEC [Conyzicola nivalis]
MKRGPVDLRLVPPAVVAWLVAALVVSAPGRALPAAIALWAVAGLALAAALVWRRALLVAVAVCAVSAGLVCTTAAVAAPVRQPTALLDAADDGRYVTLTVTTTETVGGEPDASARDGPFSATATTMTLGEARSVTVGAPVLVFDARPVERAGIGSTLALGGTIVATAPEDDVGFLVFADGPARVTAPPPWFLDWANGLRGSFAEAAARLDGEGAALLPGLAIGDTSAVGEQLDAAMKATSLSHLTAVSGANCAIVVALIMLAGAMLGVSRGARIGASVAVLVGFVVLVTPQASVVRAGVMAVIVLLSTAGGRPVRGIPVLSLATLVLLATDPWLSRDYGFVLSVLATGGLLVLTGPLSRLLQRVLPLGVSVVIAVPLAAQLACQPVLLMLAPSIPTYGIAANALAEPAAPFATVLGLLACVTLPVLPWLGEALTAVAWVPSSWIAAVAGFFAGLPGGAIPWPEGPVGVGLLAVVTVGGLIAALAPVSRRARLGCAATAVVLLVGLAGAVAGVRVVQQWSRPGDWQIAACDIGQGDAVLLRSGGRTALVDTGPDPASLARCLDELGVGRIDLLVLSHFDLDHVGGTETVFGRVDRAIVGPSGEVADDRLVADLAAGGAAVERVSRGGSGLFGELRYTVLWPPARLGSVEPGNDASVVLAFEPVGACANGCLGSLFLGDLGERAQALMLAAGPVPRVDVVKVSHHGSGDQLDRVYERADATVGVIGVGAENTYGHPTERLLDLLARVGTAATRTDTDGLVLLAPGSAPDEVRVWRQKAPP